MKAFKATVSGKVQGVWFRDSTRKEAAKLNVVGWVKNMPDGTVYLEAEGAEENLKEFEQWLHVGSPMSQVNRIEVEWIEPTGEYSTFEMKF
ncbi:MAG: acylphosphatase [Candidatus Neomarinimicrobiota bacterium]|nr:MAG: acylphosphatase [Candidatus Neomarinimicrobiota bacterium]